MRSRGTGPAAIAVLATLALVSIAGMASGLDFLDRSGRDVHFQENRSLTPVSEEPWGEGFTGADINTFANHTNASVYELDNSDFSLFMAVNISEPNDGEEIFQIHNGSCGLDNCYARFNIHEGGTSGDGFVTLHLHGDDCSGDQNNDRHRDSVPEGLNTISVVVSGGDTTWFVNGTEVRNAGFGTGELCTENAEKAILAQRNGHVGGNNVDAMDEHELLDLRFWNRALSDDEQEALHSLDGQTREGTEVGWYTFGDTEPQPPPQPVDFSDGIQDAIAAWGFRTDESQMFFALASIGITMVATGTGTKIMRSGRNKNLVIAGAGLLVAVFFVLVQMLEFWMLTVAIILGGFALMGGPREVRNTWQEVTEAAEEQVQHVREETGMQDDREVIEVDVDDVAVGPEVQRRMDNDAFPTVHPETLEPISLAEGFEITGAAPEPDLSPVTSEGASFVSDGGDE